LVLVNYLKSNKHSMPRL